MKLIKPAYYDTFRCVAGNCPDSCCHEWTVAVDETSAARYAALPGALGDDLRRAMTEEDGDVILALTPDRRCPMWRDDGLCRIQAELGEDALCATCAMFPRLRHDYGAFVELGLELSCPEAARLILAADSHDVVTQTLPGGGVGDYEQDVMDTLLRTRETLLRFLDETTMPLGEALAVVLLYAASVQDELDGGGEAYLDTDLTALRAFLTGEASMEAVTDFFLSLDILTDRWRARLQAPAGGALTDAHRALARYGIQRYYLQAVSDYDLLSRVKMVILSCLLIAHLGGDLLTTAQLYAKEIENSADNVDTILDATYTHPALTDAALLTLLLR